MVKSGKRDDIPAQWRNLFELIPNYDPLEQAGECYFDPWAADNSVNFFTDIITHVKGDLAGKPFVLEDWQAAPHGCMFGWKRPDGKRRYREVFIYVGKKNGKTAWMAGTMLFVMATDEEQGGELYSAASSREQAAKLFEHAVGMVEQEPELNSRIEIFGRTQGALFKSMSFEETRTVYKCVASDAGKVDGSFPSWVNIDEVHRHESPELAEVLQKSAAARSQPLIIYTTTADYNRPSLCNRLLKRAHAVQKNGGNRSKVGYEPGFLPVVYEASTKDDWTKEETWRKANPNFGVTIPKDWYEDEVRKCKEDNTLLNNFLRLHMNIVTDSSVAWLNKERWDANGEEEMEDHTGHECWGGLDLASTDDTASLCLAFKSGRKLDLMWWFWCPEVTAHRRQFGTNVPYEQWVRDDLMTATAGERIDYRYIRKQINDLATQYNIIDIGFDPYNATHLATELAEEDGIEMVQFRQGDISMNEPMKELDRLNSSRLLRTGNNPVAAWQAGNIMAKMNHTGNICPDKKKSVDKIDGIVAAIMAVGRFMFSENAATSYAGGIEFW